MIEHKIADCELLVAPFLDLDYLPPILASRRDLFLRLCLDVCNELLTGFATVEADFVFVFDLSCS
jgi:hypothetical protein